MKNPYIVVGLAGAGLKNYGLYQSSFSQKKLKQYLEKLIENGLNSFDSAEIYGEADNVLSKLNSESFVFDTKINNNPDISPELYVSKVQKYKEKFKKSLGTIYFHNCTTEFLNQKWFENFFLYLEKYELDIDFGISIYKKEDVDFFLSFEAVKEVQVPANIFDISNIIYVSGLNKFRRIAIRSIFGRGVFFFGDEKLIEIFGNKVASTFIHRRKSLEDSGFLDFATTTMRYFSGLDSVDKIIVGSRDIERLLSYQSIVNLGHEFLLPFDNSEELFITNPRNWGF